MADLSINLLNATNLSPRERLILQLSADHSVAELAIQFGVKPNTIQQHIYHARLKYQDQTDRERLRLKGGAPDVRKSTGRNNVVGYRRIHENGRR